MYITIVDIDEYLGAESFIINQELLLEKDIDNRRDDESIKVVSDKNTLLGYVANSVNDVARGTHSAGYIYNTLHKNQKCAVKFILDGKIIAELI